MNRYQCCALLLAIPLSFSTNIHAYIERTLAPTYLKYFDTETRTNVIYTYATKKCHGTIITIVNGMGFSNPLTNPNDIFIDLHQRFQLQIKDHTKIISPQAPIKHAPEIYENPGCSNEPIPIQANDDPSWLSLLFNY